MNERATTAAALRWRTPREQRLVFAGEYAHADQLQPSDGYGIGACDGDGQMRPVIFLDIDGVLCTRFGAGWSRTGRRLWRAGAQVRMPARAIDLHAVARLNDLCNRSNAQIVVSSSWRINRDVPLLLKRAGFSGAFHVDWRTDADGPARQDEVARWLSTHEPVEYVVIDDWLLGLEQLRSRLVLVDNYRGLAPKDVDRALELLQGQSDSDKGRASNSRVTHRFKGPKRPSS